MFDDATVGDSEYLTVSFADETTGKIVRFERNMVFVGENNIAGGIIESGDNRVGLVVGGFFGGGIEIVGRKELEVGEVFDSLFNSGVLKFWYDDFHESIISY